MMRTYNILHIVLIWSFICAVILSAGTKVEAHVTGASFTSTSTPYVVDIGYDPINIMTGQYARFDFVLRNEKTGNPVPFDQIWVRITHASDTLLATGLLHQSIGPTTLLYVFAEPGTYKLEPSFRDADGNEIVAASFPVTVTSSSGIGGVVQQYVVLFTVFVAGCVLGALGLRTYAKRKRS